MHQDIERVLISEQELAARIAELGKQVAADYADKDPIFLGILKGVVMFFSDMIRATPIQCQIDFMAVSSYGGGTSTSGKMCPWICAAAMSSFWRTFWTPA